MHHSSTTRSLRVFSLPKLMLEVPPLCPGSLLDLPQLHNLPLAPGDRDFLPSLFVAQTLLEADNFAHHAGIGCQFHEALENSQHCSEAIARRLVFGLVATCCPHYGLGLRVGRHLPPDQEGSRPDAATKLKWASTSHVRSERINRFVPTPGGVAMGPLTFDPAVDMEQRDQENTYFPGLQKDKNAGPRFWGRREGTNLSLEEGTFPSRDVRQAGGASC